MKRFLTPAILLCLLLPADPAQGADNDPAAAIERRLDEQQKKMERLQRGLEGQRVRVKETRQKEESLLSEMESLESKLRQERGRLKEMQTDLGRHETLIAEKQAELETAKSAKEGVRLHIQQRLAAFYRMGPTGALNVLFARESLPDLLNFDEYFRRLIQYDREAVSEYREKITQLAEAQNALEEEKKTLVATIAGVKEQEQQLAETRTQRAKLLNRVKTEKKLYQRALEEIEEAAQQLDVTMEKLKREATERKKAAPKESRTAAGKKQPLPAGSGEFAASKGRLDPPITGAVTTQFGANNKGKFGIATMQNGIDIKAEPGTQVRAIHGGKVAYAGVLRGYGTIIIIDHGDHYFSLMSRVAELHKKVGDAVGRGEVVATMSDQEGLVGEGLHFEIRHGTTPENPLHWVNNAKLKITATRR